MDDVCEIVCEVKSPVTGPALKKLKQTRLPFAPLDSKSPQQTKLSTKNEKKRKLSSSRAMGSSPKTPRNEEQRKKKDSPAAVTKQKMGKVGRKQSSQLKDSPTNRVKRKRGQPAKRDKSSDVEKVKRKRGRPSLKDKTSTADRKKTLSKSRSEIISDDEVSSSIDDDTEVPKAKKKPLEQTRKLLRAFHIPTQQAEVSTSTISEEKENVDNVHSNYVNHGDTGNSDDETEIEISSRKDEEESVKEEEEDKTSCDSVEDDVKEELGTKEISQREEKEKGVDDDLKSTGSKLTRESGEKLDPERKTAKTDVKEGEVCEEFMTEEKANKGASAVNNNRQQEESECKKLKKVSETADKEEETNKNVMETSNVKPRGEKQQKKKKNRNKVGVKEEKKKERHVRSEPEENTVSTKKLDNKEEENFDKTEEESENNPKKISVTSADVKEDGNEVEHVDDSGKAEEDDDDDDGEVQDASKKEASQAVSEKPKQEAKGKITSFFMKKSTKDDANKTSAEKNVACQEEQAENAKGQTKRGDESADSIAGDRAQTGEDNEAVDERTNLEEEEKGCNMDASVAGSESGEVGTTATDGEDGEKKSPEVAIELDEGTGEDGDQVRKDAVPSPLQSVSPGAAALATKRRKLTPKQKEKEAERLLKKQERERQRQERLEDKEKKKKEKEEERLKQKEEKEKLKEDLRKKKQEEFEAKRLKKEEEQQRKEEEKKQKEEERKQREEERKQKEEERKQREEAKKQAEDEKLKQKNKLKEKFASFFVAKKREHEEAEEDDDNGIFKQFRVKEGMQLAPVIRTHLSEDRLSTLNSCVSGEQLEPSQTYLEILKRGSYVPGKSERTFPLEEKKEEDDDIEIIEDEDEDMGDMAGMIENSESGVAKKKHKAKLLSFCENRRPAYWGTWSKKRTHVSARTPFAKESMFDYEYDSDDDWEEEETGESLSDLEGEDKEEEAEGDQYEVDNDFFVPHGYLSDDEGKSDQEEEEESQDVPLPQDDNSKTKEKLKHLQAQFDEEMKQKTKQLKPRVVGCLWLADENNNPAYSQLLKILSPHKAVRLCSQLPIATSYSRSVVRDGKDQKGEEEMESEDKDTNKKFVKTFPEEAIPPLIQLLHGNRHNKIFLSREFSEFWKKSKRFAGFIARKKVEVKIQQLGQWKRCLDSGPYRRSMMWYVEKEIRDKYGLSELSLPNSWSYVTQPSKDRREANTDETDTEEGSKMPKTPKIIPITAFTRKLTPTPVSSTTSPASVTSLHQNEGAKASHHESPKPGTSDSVSPTVATKSPSISPSSTVIGITPARKPTITPTRRLTNTPAGMNKSTPSGKSSTPAGCPRKRITPSSVPQGHDITKAQQSSFTSFFKKTGDKQAADSEKSPKSHKPRGSQEVKDPECITLE